MMDPNDVDPNALRQWDDDPGVPPPPDYPPPPLGDLDGPYVVAPVTVTVLRPLPGAVLPPVEANFLLEGVDGGPPTDGDVVVQLNERTFTHGGVHYAHVADHADGRWIYRAMP